MLGLKCRPPNTKISLALREQNLLVAPAGENVVRLLPPLTVTDGEIADAIDRIDRAARQVESAS